MAVVAIAAVVKRTLGQDGIISNLTVAIISMSCKSKKIYDSRISLPCFYNNLHNMWIYW